MLAIVRVSATKILVRLKRLHFSQYYRSGYHVLFLPLSMHFQNKLLIAGSFHEQSKVIRSRGIILRSILPRSNCQKQSCVYFDTWRIFLATYLLTKFSKLNRADPSQSRWTSPRVKVNIARSILSIYPRAPVTRTHFGLILNADDNASYVET